MTIVTYVVSSAVCDVCGDDCGDGPVSDRPRKREARAAALADGWVYRGGKDICPRCISCDLTSWNGYRRNTP